MNKIQRGNTAELLFAAEANERDFIVSFPVSHNSPYDIVLSKDKIFTKIQIKRAFKSKHGRRNKDIFRDEKATFVIDIKRRTNLKSYVINDFHYLVACDVDKKDFWIIPFDVVIKFKRSVWLETKELIKYKNKWDIIV